MNDPFKEDRPGLTRVVEEYIEYGTYRVPPRDQHNMMRYFNTMPSPYRGDTLGGRCGRVAGQARQYRANFLRGRNHFDLYQFVVLDLEVFFHQEEVVDAC